MKQIKCYLIILLTAWLTQLGFAQSALGQTTNSPTNTEISVTGDVQRLIPPDSLRITALIETSASTAEETFKLAELKFKAISDTIKKLNDPTIKISERGSEVNTIAGKGSQIALGSTIQLKRFLAIESNNLTSTSTIIDSTLKAGATAITEVDYLVSSQNPAVKTATQEATNIAKSKAIELANILEIKLGDLLSVATTEEPLGSLLLQNRLSGSSPHLQYSDQQLHVLVNLRYSIKN